MYMFTYMCVYIYIYIYTHTCNNTSWVALAQLASETTGDNSYSQFSNCHVCFCGLDPGNLKFEF